MAAGWVLAGGRSSRMGQDKSRMLFEGQSMVEHALSRLRAVCQSVRISGPRSPELSQLADVVEDQWAGCGPLGGIASALDASSEDWNLFLPVDVPLVPVAWLQRLVQTCPVTDSLAIVTRILGRPEPLMAVYHRRLLDALRASLHAGHYKVLDAVANGTEICWVDAFDVPESSFANLNTQEEFAAVIQRLDERTD